MCGVWCVQCALRAYTLGESIQPPPLLYISVSVEIHSFFVFGMCVHFHLFLSISFAFSSLQIAIPFSVAVGVIAFFCVLHDFQYYNKTSYKFLTNKENSPSFQLVVLCKSFEYLFIWIFVPQNFQRNNTLNVTFRMFTVQAWWKNPGARTVIA